MVIVKEPEQGAQTESVNVFHGGMNFINPVFERSASHDNAIF
jgi:hypothetical protein